MGIVNSEFGPIKQSVGGLTFSNWKGRNVVKRKPASYNDAKTPTQLANRRKLKVLVAFGRLLLAVIRVGFKSVSQVITQWNNFVKNNIQAVTDDGTTSTITYASVILSLGNLLGLVNAAGAAGSLAGDVDLTWDANSNGTTGLDGDVLQVAWYSPTTGNSGFTAPGETRVDGASPYNVGAAETGNTIEFYLFFKEAAGNNVCDSVHLQGIAG